MPASTTDEKVIAKKQSAAISAARAIVTRHMNILKKGQPKGEPIKLDGESFRKDLQYDIAQSILKASGCPCPEKDKFA